MPEEDDEDGAPEGEWESQPGFLSRDTDLVTEEAFLVSEVSNDPNFAILVLAIGQWFSRPYYPDGEPLWVLNACKRYYDFSQTSTRKVSSKTKGSAGQPADGDILELVADLLLDPDVRSHVDERLKWANLSDREAIRIAAGVFRQTAKDHIPRGEVTRLLYHWSRDRDRRLSRGLERFGAKRMARSRNARSKMQS